MSEHIQDREQSNSDESAETNRQQSHFSVPEDLALAQTDTIARGRLEQESTSPSVKEWLAGFVQIIYRPSRLDALRGANVFKIYAAGALLLALSSTLSLWISASNPVLLQQSYECMKAVANGDVTNLPKPGSHFDVSQALGSTVLINGLVGYALMGAMLWLLHRVFTKEPLEVFAFLGICSYTASISALGFLVNVAFQTIFSSISAGTSLAWLVSYRDQPFMSGFLLRFDFFSVWAYYAVGLAVAGFLAKSRIYAIVLAALGLLIHVLFVASITYLSFSISQSAH